MRYLGVALVGLLMTTALAQATWDYQYARDGEDGAEKVSRSAPSDVPMVQMVDARIRATKEGNDHDFRAFARYLGQGIETEQRTAALAGLEAIQKFADALIDPARGLLGQLGGADKTALPWGIRKWVSAIAPEGDNAGRAEGEIAARVRALIENADVVLDEDGAPDGFSVGGEPVRPVATAAVDIKSALALFAYARNPKDFAGELAREVQRFFWTTNPLPQAVLDMPELAAYPFLRTTESGMVQVGYPSLGFAFGAHTGPIKDASSFVNPWGGESASTMIMEAAAKKLAAADPASVAWPVYSAEQAMQDYYVGMSEAFMNRVRLVALEDVQPGDLLVRRWGGGSVGVVRLVEDSDAGRTLVIAEANRSDPKPDEGLGNGERFDGQGYRIVTLEDLLKNVGEKPVSTYILRATEAADALISALLAQSAPVAVAEVDGGDEAAAAPEDGARSASVHSSEQGDDVASGRSSPDEEAEAEYEEAGGDAGAASSGRSSPDEAAVGAGGDAEEWAEWAESTPTPAVVEGTLNPFAAFVEDDVASGAGEDVASGDGEDDGGLGRSLSHAVEAGDDSEAVPLVAGPLEVQDFDEDDAVAAALDAAFSPTSDDEK